MGKKHKKYNRCTKRGKGCNYYLLLHEMNLLKDHYDFLKYRISGGVLTCEGTYSQTGIEYTYKVVYDGNIPKVFITNPKIECMIHRYKDGALCLYYHKELPWRSVHMNLYDTIIPWTHEWILFYEIYRQTGKWEHPEVVHQNGKESVAYHGLHEIVRNNLNNK